MKIAVPLSSIILLYSSVWANNLPKGPYSDTCININYKDSILSAKCLIKYIKPKFRDENDSGLWNISTLNISTCEEPLLVNTYDGKLVCDNTILGSYLNVCKKPIYDSKFEVLSAYCKTDQGDQEFMFHYPKASNGREVIYVDKLGLAFDKPVGQYLKECKDITWDPENQRLGAKCLSVSETQKCYKGTSMVYRVQIPCESHYGSKRELNYAGCQLNTSVRNYNGNLVCEKK